MTRARVLVAAAAALLAIPTAAQAANVRAGLRAVTETRAVLGDDGARVGAARAYLDSTGTARALPANTALGQLVAGAGAAGVDLTVTHDDQFGGFVAGIAGAAAPATGFWALYVDNVSSQTGAETTLLGKGQELVWVLDPDFSEPGPFFLDLDAIPAGKHKVTFRVTRAGATQPVPAKGATLTINGQKVRVPASGRVGADIRGDWTARATLKGTIRSEQLSGTA